jgi:hypothetical protein
MRGWEIVGWIVVFGVSWLLVKAEKRWPRWPQ